VEPTDTNPDIASQENDARGSRDAEDMFVTKKCVFREKLRCDALDIQVQNLVYK
jgi:hypothetical protein